jgi:hypothetical protein
MHNQQAVCAAQVVDPFCGSGGLKSAAMFVDKPFVDNWSTRAAHCRHEQSDSAVTTTRPFNCAASALSPWNIVEPHIKDLAAKNRQIPIVNIQKTVAMSGEIPEATNSGLGRIASRFVHTTTDTHSRREIGILSCACGELPPCDLDGVHRFRPVGMNRLFSARLTAELQNVIGLDRLQECDLSELRGENLLLRFKNLFQQIFGLPHHTLNAAFHNSSLWLNA